VCDPDTEETNTVIQSAIEQAKMKFGIITSRRYFELEKMYVQNIDISQYRLRFGLSLLYKDRVPFELLLTAQLSYEGGAALEGGK
jgi:hypothetical protein